MALSASTTWEVRSTGVSTNGGGFDVGNANFDNTITATGATGTAPVITWTNYTFVATDVGSLLFILSGTNWIPGFYPIVSVTNGTATLNAAIGAVQLYGGATLLNTVAGCATTASPTAGKGAIDYSQQNTGVSLISLSIDGTTNTTLAGSTPTIGKAWVGNIINIPAGSGFTGQRVQVSSVTGTTATVDKSLGTLSSTGGTGVLGGALDGLGTLSSVMVANNKAFIQTSGGYSSATTATFNAAGVDQSPTTPVTTLIGYTNIRGDSGMAVLTLSTNSGLTGLIFTNRGWRIRNITVNCNGLTTSTGFTLPQYTDMYNCKVMNFGTYGINCTNTNILITKCEITGGISTATGGINSGSSAFVRYCYIHNNACNGIYSPTKDGLITKNLIAYNTGATSDGISINNTLANVTDNIICNNGRSGIHIFAGGAQYLGIILNNLIANNASYGIDLNQNGFNALPLYDGNAYFNNTLGNRHYMDDIGTICPVNGIAPYVNTHDVVLTADPFIDVTNGDFRLNSNVGGGAACRGAGAPTTWPGNTLTVSAPDIGAVQHADTTVVSYWAK